MPHPKQAVIGAAYEARISEGAIRDDEAQRVIVARLDELLAEISTHRLASKKSALGWLFARRDRKPAPRGLYIHGAVGRGKTMLMDLFFIHLQSRRKRRAHFNDFMADVHERIHAHRQMLERGETRETDPVPPVAAALYEEARILCFDEFSVTDITDAMLLSRLFEQLFARGCILVATSNVAPDDLYRDGLNRQLFLPFIDLLKANCDILGLDAPTDYRLEDTARLPVFHRADQPGGAAEMDTCWQKIVAGRPVAPDSIARKGRSLVIPSAVDDAARLGFADLCEKPLGAADYMAIAERYPTLFIDDIPVLARDQRNAAKRFITLIDVLYDQGTRLFFSTHAPLDELYPTGTGTEKFEFERTISRLTEMQSETYLADSRAGKAAEEA
ncbi:cell division protein ZapE [Pseudohoeflea coraliihabitans]|uniref:AFG1 family ATPase n=1 Tax=Pseudohoeflea coraliihabitans TaxID=2860393 RepID=A0ABS6WLU7_9HYPH|nr:cell division protein ZapE [Pseudohoeflea sp. DP4N28-3]MBW3096755.1 AFG1 family ATPase [Pseudohoeflea sp. DP4N28-3]